MNTVVFITMGENNHIVTIGLCRLHGCDNVIVPQMKCKLGHTLRMLVDASNRFELNNG